MGRLAVLLNPRIRSFQTDAVNTEASAPLSSVVPVTIDLSRSWSDVLADMTTRVKEADTRGSFLLDVCARYPNRPALEFVNDDVKSNPGIYPPADTVAKAFVMKANSPDFEEVLTRTWTRIKTGQ